MGVPVVQLLESAKLETNTIYASFVTIAEARAAIQSLIVAGVAPDTVTVASKNGGGVEEKDADKPVQIDQEFGAMTGSFPDLRAAGPGNVGIDSATAGSGMRMESLAASANASTSPGSMTDYLWASLPSDMAQYYRQIYEGGRAIVVVQNANEKSEQILRDKGALQVHRQGRLTSARR